MKNQTIYRKVLVSDRLPETEDYVVVFEDGRLCCVTDAESSGVVAWLEEIELPSEEEIFRNCIYSTKQNRLIYMDGANYILGIINQKK